MFLQILLYSHDLWIGLLPKMATGGTTFFRVIDVLVLKHCVKVFGYKKYIQKIEVKFCFE